MRSTQPAEIALHRAGDDADERGDDGDDQGEQHRQPEAVDHPGEHVARGVVGAEPVVGVGRRGRGGADVVDRVVAVGDRRPEQPALVDRLARDLAVRGVGDHALGVVETALAALGR